MERIRTLLNEYWMYMESRQTTQGKNTHTIERILDVHGIKTNRTWKEYAHY